MTRAAECTNITKKFGDTKVLDDINFHVDEGEIVVLLGSSGSGKTTILRIIAGLESAESGKVVLHSKDVTDLPARERGVGVILQSYSLFPKMTVEQNIGYGLRLRRRPRSEIKNRVDELIELVNLDEHRLKRPSQLSGGQQQRVAIARALAYHPEILLFDEPFSALDAQIRSRLRREIRRLLKKINVPAIFITHDQEEALEIADRIAVLNEGRIEQIDTPYRIYNMPRTEYVAKFIGTANLLSGVVNRGVFECENVDVALPDDVDFKNGEPAKLVFRPEDVFLRHPENLTQDYHDLTDGWIEELNFVGSYERVVVKLGLAESQMITVTRPKSETIVFPLEIGQKVHVGLVRFRLLPYVG
ncbi:MAG: ABC transporter ATP-binding protein [Acidobacteria bacterium]|nr:ABC transporter ATP-binding protein [Acidobacteriota bacterium]